MAAAPVDSRTVAAPAFPPVLGATPDEGHAMLDEAAQYYLGISGKTFLQRWERGFYATDPDQPGVMNVAALLSFVQAHAPQR